MGGGLDRRNFTQIAPLSNCKYVYQLHHYCRNVSSYIAYQSLYEVNLSACCPSILATPYNNALGDYSIFAARVEEGQFGSDCR